jgi:hypothetical protein
LIHAKIGGRQLVGTVTGGGVHVSRKFRPHRSTLPDRDWTSGMERTAHGWMQSARHLAMKNDALASEAWRGQWNGGKQRAGIGMTRICK